jgi:hypothetical protein
VELGLCFSDRLKVYARVNCTVCHVTVRSLVRSNFSGVGRRGGKLEYLSV